MTVYCCSFCPVRGDSYPRMTGQRWKRLNISFTGCGHLPVDTDRTPLFLFIYNCYDGGEHTDSDPQAEWPGRETLPQPRLYLVEERAEEQTEAAPLPVPLASGQ